MKKTFNIHVKRDEEGYEAYDFYHEELDDLLIPSELLEKLLDPLIIETLSYDDISRCLTPQSVKRYIVKARFIIHSY